MAFNIPCISPQSGLWGSMIVSKNWSFAPGFSPCEPMHHFQFNKSEVVNGTCAKSDEPSDLTAWIKDTCILLCICIKNIYMYVCVYIYTHTPYITCTQLQIHQQRCMLPQDWASTQEKGPPPLCTTCSHSALRHQQRYLFLWYQAATDIKLLKKIKFLYHFALCTPLIISHGRNEIYSPVEEFTALLSLLMSPDLCTFESPPGHWREWVGASDKLVGVHWNPVWSYSPLLGAGRWSVQGFIAVQSGSPKLLSLKQGSFIWSARASQHPESLVVLLQHIRT